MKPFKNYNIYLIVFFSLVVCTLIFTFGILIGQKNAVNLNNTTLIKITNSKGSSVNIFSSIKKTDIKTINPETKINSVTTGSFEYITPDPTTRVLEYQLKIQTNHNKIDQEILPLNYDIVGINFDQDGKNHTEKQIGEVALNTSGNKLNTIMQGSYTFDNDTNKSIQQALQFDLIMLKIKGNLEKSETNTNNKIGQFKIVDQNLPLSLQNQTMPYFWIKF
jgi:hypothetical protein